MTLNGCTFGSQRAFSATRASTTRAAVGVDRSLARLASTLRWGCSVLTPKTNTTQHSPNYRIQLNPTIPYHTLPDSTLQNHYRCIEKVQACTRRSLPRLAPTLRWGLSVRCATGVQCALEGQLAGLASVSRQGFSMRWRFDGNIKKYRRDNTSQIWLSPCVEACQELRLCAAFTVCTGLVV